jgi:cell division transport system ATP-binding protein
MKLLYLAWPPSRGVMSMFGRDASELHRDELPDYRRRIGVVFQDFRLLDHLTAFENVALPRKIMGEDLSKYKNEVEELLTWVGLGHRLQAMPSTLSGGEKQRVAIARAVIVKPDLLLADEPTGNVDPEMGERLLRLIIEMNRVGTTVLLATHDPLLVNSYRAPQLHLDKGLLSYVPTKIDPKAPELPLGQGTSVLGGGLKGAKMPKKRPQLKSPELKSTSK